MKRNRVFALIAIAGLALMGCSKEVEDKGPPKDPDPYTEITFDFVHEVDGADIELDTAQYPNQVGNIYGVNTLKYLIGRVRMDSWGNQDPTYIEEYHLVDINDPVSMSWKLKDTVLIDDYQNVTFFMGFGFDEKRNETGLYKDLNNVGWGWSPNRGGGYYTLRISGNFYSNSSATTQNNYDLGIGGYVKKETQVDTTWVLNPIYCSMTQGFSIPKGTKTVNVEVRFNVNRLFRSAQDFGNFDLNVFTSNLEENSLGSKTLSENLEGVFKLGKITIDGQEVVE